jgi:hypothetical protein
VRISPANLPNDMVIEVNEIKDFVGIIECLALV